MIVADILGIHPTNQYRESVFVVFLCLMDPTKRLPSQAVRHSPHKVGPTDCTLDQCETRKFVSSFVTASDYCDLTRYDTSSSPFGATSAFPTIRHLYGVSEPSQRFKIILLIVA
ncbi:hypothetical protein Bca4012_059545 [Brassica carinata]